MPLAPVVDSNLGLPDPAEQARKEAELAVQLAGTQQRNQLIGVEVQQHQLALDEAKRKAEADARLQADIATLGEAPSAAQVYRVIYRNPQVADKYKPFADQLKTEEKAALGAQTMQILMPLLNGDNKAAMKVGEDIAKAYDNAGKAGDAKALRAKLAMIPENAASIIADLSATGSALLGHEGYLDATKNTKVALQAAKADAEDKEAKAGISKIDLETERPKRLSEINQANSAAAASQASARASDASVRKSNFDIRKGEALLPSERQISEADATTKKAAAVEAARLYKAQADEAVAKAITAAAGAKEAPAVQQAMRIQAEAKAKLDAAQSQYADRTAVADIGEKEAKALLAKVSAGFAVSDKMLDQQLKAAQKEKYVQDANEKREAMNSLGKDAIKKTEELGAAESQARTAVARIKPLIDGFKKLGGYRPEDPIPVDLSNKGDFTSSGVPARIAEWLKAFTGNEDSRTRLRQLLRQETIPKALQLLRNNAIGGISRITNAEFMIAQKGFPEDTENPLVIARSLELALKGYEAEEKMSRVERMWLYKNKTPGAATKDMSIDGVSIPAGTDLEDAKIQYLRATMGDDRAAKDTAPTAPSPASVPASPPTDKRAALEAERAALRKELGL